MGVRQVPTATEAESHTLQGATQAADTARWAMGRRNAAIREAYQKGHSLAAIGRAVSLSREQVRRIALRLGRDGKPLGGRPPVGSEIPPPTAG